MQAARAGGLHSVGVTWGGIHARESLVDAQVIVDRAAELLDVL